MDEKELKDLAEKAWEEYQITALVTYRTAALSKREFIAGFLRGYMEALRVALEITASERMARPMELENTHDRNYNAGVDDVFASLALHVAHLKEISHG